VRHAYARVTAGRRSVARTAPTVPVQTAEPPTAWDIKRHFGSWKAAVEAAGLTPRPQVAKRQRSRAPRDR
jgi:Homing endonuclease associated repeat